jgi:methylase of polypeptide subunit release factors
VRGLCVSTRNGDEGRKQNYENQRRRTHSCKALLNEDCNRVARRKVDETNHGPRHRVEPDEVDPATSAEAALPAWMSALEARHLADLRIAEVTRALRALSSAYVERRHAGKDAIDRKVRGTLDSAGKRAAFALFYAPLHFIAVARAVAALGARTRPRQGDGGQASVLDLGCGSGAAGAAWALASGSTSSIIGIDQHRWTIEESRWTYAHFGLRGRARIGDITRLPPARSGDSIVAAYVLNELPDPTRQRLEDRLLAAADRGARVLVVEPIARAITPWWNDTAVRVAERGGRADEWRIAIDLPPLLKTLDHAAGLNHRELTFRTLFI